MTIVSLRTPLTRLSGDMADVVRIFYGNIELHVNQDAPAALCIEHEHSERGGVWRCRMTVDGAAFLRQAPVPEGELLQKRLLKRLVKQTLYDALKARAGRTPPWGSLTGIRPTRLLYEAMSRGLTLPQAVRSLRDTFDVTEEKAALLAQVVKTQQTLPPPDARAADLYVGIPFCTTRCAYCSFLSGEVGKGAQLAPYAAALEREIAGVSRLLDETGLAVRAFYMGGGTPTALPAALLGRVLRAAAPFLRRAREITVEAGRPDTIDAEKLALLRDAGVTRISINPQTSHDETLRRIGRAHTAAQTEDAYALARRMGFTHINMDLIAGLPGETLPDFERTLAWARGLAPESLTVHTLCIKRSSNLHLWEAQLPDGEMTAAMVRAAAAAAGAMGMAPYYLYRQKYMAGNLENVGYALPGHACLYNVDIMEETTHILAMGAGGISKRVYPEIGRIERAPNVSEITHYLARTDEMLARKRALLGL